MDTPDLTYITRCRNGAADDFRFLVRRYEGPVFAFVSTRISDRALAREAVQEAFVRAYFALDRLEKPEAFHSWLLGIARRVASEFHRTRTRRQEVPEQTDAGATAPDLGGPEENDPLDEAIAALPEAQRQMILLRYFERLSCQEIADRLRVPLGTVTKTLSRAYTELRELLSASEGNSTRLEKIS